MALIREDQDYNYVELFAGCGGMSLGLESAGFTRLLANEVSPMAAETFAYNLVRGARNAGQPTVGDIASWRNYFSFLDMPDGAADGTISEKSFRGRPTGNPPCDEIPDEARKVLSGGGSPNLLVGDAVRLAAVIEQMSGVSGRVLWKGLGKIDILAGGPPCQSFSLAGKRQKDNPRNSLFHSFVKVARVLKPRVVLLENVLGITKPFRDDNGNEWHPWHEVCRAFRAAGFIPVPSLVNAADFGVPQTRLRFILIGLRDDVAKGILKLDATSGALKEAIRLGSSRYGEGSCWLPGDDINLIFRTESDADMKRWPRPLFPQPIKSSERIGVRDAIGDLLALERGGEYSPGNYAKMLNRKLKRPDWIAHPGSIENHRLRKHGDRTRARFRLMRILANAGFRAKSMTDVMKNQQRSVKLLTDKRLYLPDGDGGFHDKLMKAEAPDVERLLMELASAKHAQRCLDPEKPAPAQLSIPDDLIHWEADRVLSVREMARLQSFPDWFVFRSKETTGGVSRSYEVPQYTQVGNAVPPLLAKSLGEAILELLACLDGSRRNGAAAIPPAARTRGGRA